MQHIQQCVALNINEIKKIITFRLQYLTLRKLCLVKEIDTLTKH